MENNFRVKRILKALKRTYGITIDYIHYVDGIWILIDNKNNTYKYDEKTGKIKIINKEAE